MLTVHSTPTLRRPVLLCGFSGWPDAGSAASGAVEYLRTKRAPRRFAELDARAIYVQSNNRPISQIVQPGERRLEWPSLALYALPIAEAPRDLVLLLGAEPDLRWRRCASTLVDYCRALGVDTIVTLGAFLAPVSHGGPVRLTGRSSRPDFGRVLTSLGLRDGAYEGPTGFPTALLDAAQRKGLGTASIWAASPVYLRGLVNPKLSASLLGVVERLLELDLGIAELATGGRDLERRIDAELRTRPDLERFVQRLAVESEDDGGVDEGVEVADELPSADEILDDLEQHLRRLRRGDQAP